MYLQLFLIFLSFSIYKWYASAAKGSWQYETKRTKYAKLLAFLCIMQSGLRNVAVGADTFAYKQMFKEDSALSWHEIFDNFITVYVHGEGKDAGYIVFEKLASYICFDFQIFLFLVAIIFFVPLWRMVYKNTTQIKDLFFAFVLYQALFYEFFSITGLRQTVATGFCLWGYEYIKERRLKPFIVCIIIGTIIHKSCLIFLPLYWIANYKKPFLMYFASLFSFPIMYGMARAFTLQLVQWSGNTDAYMQYLEESTSGAVMLSFFYIGVSILVFIKYLSNKKFIVNHANIANAISVGLFLMPLSFVSSSLIRIVQYYSIFLLVFISYYTTGSSKTNVLYKIVFACVFTAILYKIFKSNYQYAFFWEYMKLGDNYYR